MIVCTQLTLHAIPTSVLLLIRMGCVVREKKRKKREVTGNRIFFFEFKDFSELLSEIIYIFKISSFYNFLNKELPKLSHKKHRLKVYKKIYFYHYPFT